MVWSRLKFTDLEFHEEKDKVRVIFYKHYSFDVEKSEFQKVALFRIFRDGIEFLLSEKAARNKLNRILESGFARLCSFNNRPAVYVHRNSGIPLVGSNVFGIVDRDTDILEIKPLTGCNLNCVFCSVDEGLKSRKVRDFVVEEEYLVEEFVRIAKRKSRPVEAHIAGQNEPLLYAKLTELVSDIRNSGLAGDISIDTNGVLLTRKKVDELVSAGLTRVNLSVNALDLDLARKMAGACYDVSHVLSMARYIKSKISLLLAPVLVPGMNDEEVKKIILLSKEIGCPIGIQNYLEYERGRRPVKQMKMQDFYALLDEWSRAFDVDLRLEKLFSVNADKVLERPMKKGDVVRAQVVCMGKYAGEVICAAHNRSISMVSDASVGDVLKVKIVREKHNIYKGS